MGKRKKGAATEKAKKTNPLVYGVLFLLAGALLGGGLSVAVLETSGKGQGAPQQEREMDAKLKTLTDRVALAPGDGDAWIALGNLYFDTHQHEKSIEAYARALEIKPGNPDVLTDMGVMYRAVGEPQKALDAFAKAVAAAPRHETARLNTGVVLFHDLGDKAGALRAWQELVRINPQAKTPDGMLVSDMIRQMGGEGAGGAEAGRRLLKP